MSSPASRPGVRTGPGLTPAGAVLLALGLSLLGGAVDVVTGVGLRSVFAVCFVAGCVLAAALVRRSGLRTAVVAPPLIYALLALLAGLTRGSAVPSSVSREALELFTELVFGAPVLLAGTVGALVVAGLRRLRGR